MAQNLNFNAEICAFLSKDKTQTAKDFVNEAVKAKMQGGEVDFKERLILTADFINNPRLKCIYTRFYRGNNTISNYLKSFLKDGPKGYLKFSTNPNFGNDDDNHINSKKATAITISTKNNIIEIVFNTNTQNPNAVQNTSTILVGLALIHEVVHAEMYRKLLEASEYSYIPKKGTSAWDELETKLYDNFYEYFDLFTRLSFKNPNPTDIQHELMAQSYVQTIAKALADFDDNQRPADFYENISWTGLQNSESYKKKFSTDLNAFYKFANSYKQAQNETKDCTN